MPDVGQSGDSRRQREIRKLAEKHGLPEIEFMEWNSLYRDWSIFFVDGDHLMFSSVADADEAMDNHARYRKAMA